MRTIHNMCSVVWACMPVCICVNATMRIPFPVLKLEKNPPNNGITKQKEKKNRKEMLNLNGGFTNQADTHTHTCACGYAYTSKYIPTSPVKSTTYVKW